MDLYRAINCLCVCWFACMYLIQWQQCMYVCSFFYKKKAKNFSPLLLTCFFSTLSLFRSLSFSTFQSVAFLYFHTNLILSLSQRATEWKGIARDFLYACKRQLHVVHIFTRNKRIRKRANEKKENFMCVCVCGKHKIEGSTSPHPSNTHYTCHQYIYSLHIHPLAARANTYARTQAYTEKRKKRGLKFFCLCYMYMYTAQLFVLVGF